VHFRSDAHLVSSDGSGEPLDAGSPDARSIAGSTDAIARVEPRHAVRAGERIAFSVLAERPEFFDPATELAIWE
jgi:hypothetical protein